MRWPRWIMRRWVGPRRARRTGVINVVDFGARGDGKTDDTLAFQAAARCGWPILVPPTIGRDVP